MKYKFAVCRFAFWRKVTPSGTSRWFWLFECESRTLTTHTGDDERSTAWSDNPTNGTIISRRSSCTFELQADQEVGNQTENGGRWSVSTVIGVLGVR